MANVNYIDRCGEQVFHPPFSATITDYFGFAVQADHDELNRNICDKYFNVPLNEKDRFKAFKYVMFVFSAVDNACSLSAKYRDRGTFSYKEAAVWMLIGDSKTGRIRWFQPYILVDDSVAMVTGREIYGFPKTIGSFHIPKGPDAPDRLWVQTTVVKDVNAKGDQQLLFEAGRPPDSAAQCMNCSEDVFMSELLKTLAVHPEYFVEFGIPQEMSKRFYEDLMKMQLPLMFLKEFRSALDPSRADGLTIQEAKCKITKFHNAAIFKGPYAIAINDVHSHPIRKDLGLSQGQLTAALAFWMKFDFELGKCERIENG